MGINTKLILDIVENAEKDKPVKKLMVESRAKPNDEKKYLSKDPKMEDGQNEFQFMVEGKDKEVEAIKREAVKLAKKLGGEVEDSRRGNASWAIRFPNDVAFEKQKDGNTAEYHFYMTTNEMQYKGKWKDWFEVDYRKRDIKRVREPYGDVVFYFQGIDP